MTKRDRLKCPNCKKRIPRQKDICQCGYLIGLEDYGYKIVEARRGYYALFDKDDHPLHTLRSFGEKTQKKLAKEYDIPLKVLDRAFAKTLTSEDVEEEDDRETIVGVPALISKDFIAEMVRPSTEEVPYFLVKRFGRPEITVAHQLQTGTVDKRGRPIVYRPLIDETLEKGIVIIPSGYIEATFEETYRQAKKFLTESRAYDTGGRPEELWLIGILALGSWFVDKLIRKFSVPIAGISQYAPMIAIRGPSGSGKKPLMSLLRLLSYHPYYMLGTERIPSIFRPLDRWKGTLLMEECDFKDTGTQAAIIQFINSRADGTPLSRQNPNDPQETHAFGSYGITIITQRQDFVGDSPENRSFPFISEKTSNPKMPSIVPDEVIEEGLLLQQKLLYLRLMHWEKIKVDPYRRIPGLLDHRITAALLPTLALGDIEPKLLAGIRETAVKVVRAKTLAKRDSRDGLIINFIWDCLKKGGLKKWDEYWYVASKIVFKVKNKKGVEKDVEVFTPLTAQGIVDGLGWRSARALGRSLRVFQLMPEDLQGMLINVRSKTYRAILFEPRRLEKHLMDFVLDYKAGGGLGKPSDLDVIIARAKSKIGA